MFWRGEINLNGTTNSNHHFNYVIKPIFGRYIKKYFGKGPEKISVNTYDDQVVIELAGYLNEAEKKVLGFAGAEAVIKNYRGLLLETLCRSIDPIELKLGLPIKDVWFDFHPAKDMCYVILKLCKENTELKKPDKG